MENIIEDLRVAIVDYRGGPRKLARRAGVPYTAVWRFLKGERGLTLLTAALLCEKLDLRLVKPAIGATPGKSKATDQVEAHSQAEAAALQRMRDRIRADDWEAFKQSVEFLAVNTPVQRWTEQDFQAALNLAGITELLPPGNKKAPPAAPKEKETPCPYAKTSKAPRERGSGTSTRKENATKKPVGGAKNAPDTKEGGKHNRAATERGNTTAEEAGSTRKTSAARISAPATTNKQKESARARDHNVTIDGTPYPPDDELPPASPEEIEEAARRFADPVYQKYWLIGRRQQRWWNEHNRTKAANKK